MSPVSSRTRVASPSQRTQRPSTVYSVSYVHATVSWCLAASLTVQVQTKALSNEWSVKGVNVNAIAPGYIATDVRRTLLLFALKLALTPCVLRAQMNTALINNPTRTRQIMERIPAGRWGAPSDFEGAVVFLASPASDYVCGECLLVDGGWMGR